ncbi:MAG: ABC transporter ATP-binding protein, partial [Treponema sp.]|nr:ABC transporter ATP-binding protein [Treponema sp.]
MLSMIFITLVLSRASMTRVVEVLDEVPEIKNPEPHAFVDQDSKISHGVFDRVPNGSVDFRDVSFSYHKDPGNCVLSNVNLHIESGQMVGIIGGTGSSKTTLVSLIPRLYDVLSGSVSVGGIDVRKYDIKALRDGVAMVLQKNVLFSGSIKSNLKWGDENAGDGEIIAACKASDAYEFVSTLPNGFDTDLGQGGVNLSGGQKQRLCIARALLKKPKILILDDSTSAVDTATDARIRAALRSNLPDTTKIIIAQRINSVQDADIIFVMDNGKICGIGNHRELLETNSIYREVYESQQSKN